VRVQISQLRKKLQEHFAGPGRHEPLVIEIPKGCYVPVFRHRSDKNGHAECFDSDEANWLASPHPEQPGSSSTVPKKYIAVGVIAAALIFATILFAFRAGKRSALASDRPTVNAFWIQLFDDGQPTNVVMSDVTLIPFQKLIGQPVPLPEYETREFQRLATQKLQDPVRRGLAEEVVNRVATSISDVQVVRDFGVLASENHLPLTLMSARDMSSELMSSENSIILGSWRANPWVGLFEGQMTFRTEYQESPPSVRFVNSSPLQGEKAAYPAEWRREGYCRVTYLPNPQRTGSVLVISGTDVISTEAGGRLLTTESSLRDLKQKLGVKTSEPFPYFELLLRTEIVNNAVPRFELVAYRSHPR
jgi:hypothetical protein